MKIQSKSHMHIKKALSEMRRSLKKEGFGDIHVVSLPAHNRTPERRETYPLRLYVHKGEATLLLDEKRFTLNTSSDFTVPPNTKYVIQTQNTPCDIFSALQIRFSAFSPTGSVIQEKIQHWIEKHPIGVLSFANQKGKPMAVKIMAYPLSNMVLIGGIDSETVAFHTQSVLPISLVFWGNTEETVQYEGVLRKTSLDVIPDDLRARIQKNTPHSNNQIIIEIKPSWIRHTNAGTAPWDIKEITYTA